MLHNHISNNTIRHLHERCFRLIYIKEIDTHHTKIYKVRQLRCLKLRMKCLQKVLLIFLRKKLQKQPSRGALKKSCSENMQQIYRRTPMLKCDFTHRHGCSPANLLHIFRTPFSKNTSRWLLLELIFAIVSKTQTILEFLLYSTSYLGPKIWDIAPDEIN